MTTLTASRSSPPAVRLSAPWPTSRNTTSTLWTLTGTPSAPCQCQRTTTMTTLTATCKDKTLRVINPRNGKVIAEKEKAHEGNKSSKCIFLKTGKVFTLGFSKRCDRQYALWDPKSMDKALTHEEIDQAAGVLFPFYDAGKGDTSIRYFEVNDDEPYVHYLNM